MDVLSGIPRVRAKGGEENADAGDNPRSDNWTQDVLNKRMGIETVGYAATQASEGLGRKEKEPEPVTDPSMLVIITPVVEGPQWRKQ